MNLIVHPIIYFIAIIIITPSISTYDNDHSTITTTTTTTTTTSLERTSTSLNHNPLLMHYSVLKERLLNLRSQANTSVLLHVHIPKVGGTALSIALSSECNCNHQVKEYKLMKQLCNNCPTVKSSKSSFSKQYSYSRLTGWTYGLHAPLGVIYDKTIIKQKFLQKGLFPVYIILLRDPFERFISESIHLVKKNECFRDWSSILGCMKSSHLNYRAKIPINQFVHNYSQLNMSLLLHNRQTKMIGGKGSDFNMGFVFRFEIGSRWIPFDTIESINKVELNAENILIKSPYVVFGIHERLNDMICILEILYGHLYRFNYSALNHAHKFNTTYDSKLEKLTYNIWRNTSTYKYWLERNLADVKLYAMANRLFDLQFNIASDLLKNSRIDKSRVSHCI